MKAWQGMTVAGLMCAACQTQASPSAVPTPAVQVVQASPSAVPTPAVRIVQLGTAVAPTAIRPTEPSLLPSPSATGVSTLGYLDFPNESGDAGNVVVLAGATVDITWTSTPPGAERYDFVLTLEDGLSLLLGTDSDPSNGVSIQWFVPENLLATITATAYFADGTIVTSHPSYTIHTGEAPPSHVCTLRSTGVGSVDLFYEPYFESGIYAYVNPGTYHPVLGRSDDGWYQVDAQGAYDMGSGEAASWTGWASTRHYPIGLSGPCADVPFIPVTPSADPFPTFSPGG